MIKKEMSTESALHSKDKSRMMEYSLYSKAFSYPNDAFFDFFQDSISKKEGLVTEYDRLFRANEVWLYGEEYIAKGEFQRVNNLADIMGFYQAFGLEPDKDRPDSFSIEFEFMHYLIFKRLRVLKIGKPEDAAEKADICFEAEKKFFAEHLYPAAGKAAKAILNKTQNKFYRTIAEDLLKFLRTEKRYFGRKA